MNEQDVKITLKKRTEDVKILLRKKEIYTPPKLQVELVLDHSPSALPFYYGSQQLMQCAINRLMAVTCAFDEDGIIGVTGFADSAVICDPCTVDSYSTYITDKYTKFIKGDSTFYAPAIKKVIAKIADPATSFLSRVAGIFGKKKAVSAPTLALILTDGRNFDHDVTAQLLARTKDENIYWHFVGIGEAGEFANIRDYADCFDNVGYVNLSSLDISDDDLYNAIFDQELVEWLKARSPQQGE